MELGVMFFSSVECGGAGDRYRLLLEAARFADREGFCCIWTPERHFHRFGGLFPDPAVTSAALAMVTDRLEIRAGSLVSPLHDSIRIAESWSVVDNLSGGRVAISFGSGWNVNDFVLQPDSYEQRQAIMYRQIAEVRALWRGETIVRCNSFGRETRVEVFPKPVRRELPVWVTSSGNAQTFVSAGEVGANVLTHLIGQDFAQLADKIARYREARAASGYDPQSGKVTLMLHTFLGTDEEAVLARVRGPMREYLRQAVGLEQLAALGGGTVSGGHRVAPHDIPLEALEELLDIAFERYYHTASLMGTPERCQEMIWPLEDIGIAEVACLIDFIDDEAVMESLGLVAGLRAALAPDVLAGAAGIARDSFSEEIDA